MFQPNQYNGINTYSMRVIPYRTQDIRQDHPYHRYNDVYDVRSSKHILHDLVEKGTLVEDGPMEDVNQDEITTELKDHQKRLVWEMKRYENCPFHYTNKFRIGYLCDEVGSGKSLALLSLISANKDTTQGGRSMRVPFINPIRNWDNTPNIPAVFHPDDAEASYRRIPSTLIVVPHSIFSQWKTYIESDTKLKAFYIHTTKKINGFISLIQEETPQYPDIVLVKSTQYNTLTESINQLSRDSIVYDDCIPPENSQDASMQKVRDLISIIRRSSQHMIQLQRGYDQGTETIQALSQSLEEMYHTLSENQCHIEAVNSIDTLEPGQLVHKVYIPKCGYVWDRVIIDEADTIPISNSNPIMSRMFWMVSASISSFIFPYSSPPPHRRGFIRNLIESQSQFAFYKQYAYFRSSDEALTRSFPLPDVETQIVRCFTPEHVRVAYASNISGVIDAVNAGDTEEALRLAQVDSETDSDGLIHTLRHNLQSQKEKLQNKKQRYETYKENCDRNVLELQESLSSIGPAEHLMDPNELHQVTELTSSLRLMMRNSRNYEIKIEQTIQAIESLDSRISTMEERIEESMTNDCPICLDTIEENKRAIVKCCNAAMCVDCVMQQIASYRDRTSPCPCPLCRAHLTPNTFTLIRKSSNKDTPTQEPLPTKKQTLMNLLQNPDHTRILLFSGYDATFLDIQTMMDEKNIPYALLNGSDGSIQNKIQDHVSGKTRVLCMNSRMMGAGLNLQHATDIILYHKQSNDLQKQIIGRAQRPGRNPNQALRVWKLSHAREYSS